MGREGYRPPFLATDVIVEYDDGEKEGIVLVKRKNPPYGLALPGGLAEYGLTLGENASKEVKEETGLDVDILTPMQPFIVRSHPDRDPRHHIVSVTYVAKGRGVLRAGDDAAEAHVYPLSALSELITNNDLAFDHADILNYYLKKSRTHSVDPVVWTIFGGED